MALQREQPALLLGDADQAAQVALGVDPAQRVGEDVELASVVGDSETMTVSLSRPRSVIAPTTAASLTVRRWPPTSTLASWASQAAWSAKLRRSWPARRAITASGTLCSTM
jgi:hypothetical protein